MKIYTKTGDAGQTGLLGGARVDKDSLRISAIGDVDELNAALGVARTFGGDDFLDVELGRAQALLFDLGGELASPPGGRAGYASLTEAHSIWLEASIDAMEGELAPLKNFILPGGSPLAAHLHLARAVCRRAERAVISLDRAEPVREEARIFLNRLSDWLFVAARTANRLSNVVDVDWKRSEG